jgi:hypothetical protein
LSLVAVIVAGSRIATLAADTFRPASKPARYACERRDGPRDFPGLPFLCFQPHASFVRFKQRRERLSNDPNPQAPGVTVDFAGGFYVAPSAPDLLLPPVLPREILNSHRKSIVATGYREQAVSHVNGGGVSSPFSGDNGLFAVKCDASVVGSWFL